MTRTERLQLRRYRKLRKLIEKWTRCEILARLVPVGFPEFADYHRLMLDTADEIRRLMFKSDDLLHLGTTWGILSKESPGKSKNDRKARHKKLRKA